MADPFAAFFLPVEPGHRFCIHHTPAHATRLRNGIVYVHPFGEEMNKSRRMAALQSRRLAAAGFDVLQVDLYGCGDSSGDFGDARWEVWKSDLRAAVAWLRQRVAGEVSFWGLRLGAALAVDLAREPGMGIERLLLWQPVANGKSFLTQFLRLHLAAQMLSDGAAQTGVRELRDTLARGASLEIAGYDLHPDLAASIESVDIAESAPGVRRVHWLEVTPQPVQQPAPASRRVLDAWRKNGIEVDATAVIGEPFWSTLEITDCIALLEATDQAMRQDASGHGTRPKTQQ